MCQYKLVRISQQVRILCFFFSHPSIVFSFLTFSLERNLLHLDAWWA